MGEKDVSQDEWTKNLDYLMELSAWEREMTGAIYNGQYQQAMRAADRILAHIGFVICDFNSNGSKKAIGIKTEKYLELNNLIAKGMRESIAASNPAFKDRSILQGMAYNTARSVETKLKETIDEAGLYFKFRPKPRQAMQRGLSGQ